MDRLDLLDDLLADYDGTLILVSHDRDFIDRLATSTIALDGHGRAIETPGGWKDFVRQNPGFFDQGPLRPQPSAAAPAAAVAVKLSTPAPERRSAKLTYKDQRRLEALDLAIAGYPGQIASLETRLQDAEFYQRDPQAFDQVMTQLAKLRDDFAQAEDEWLVLEEKREGVA